jgi:hypothetical protein
MNPLAASRAPYLSLRLSQLTARHNEPEPSAGPQLVPPHHHPRHSPLALWHLLSLDAPTVATLWTIFIAHCAHLTLPWPDPAAMFVAVWMIYAADRLLDARLLDPDLHSNPDLEARHHFHHHHRNRFLTTILLSAFGLVYLLTHIDPRALHIYALLATLLGVWMLLIHSRPLSNPVSHRLPKELAVGLFFPAAVFIPTVARDLTLRASLLPAAILFACVCTLNCLYLYAWEHPTPRLHAHLTTSWATHRLTYIATLTLAVATALSAITTFNTAFATSTLPTLACALSTSALLLLNAHRDRLSPIHLRAAADLALLTPLLLLPFANVVNR